MMRFLVSRTSGNADQQPCELAHPTKYTMIDERVVDSPQKLKGLGDPQAWFQRGTNHRVENGHIKRDLESDAWCIDIGNLEDLLAFVAKYGDIVLTQAFRNPELLEIEIYDDYRE